MSENTELFRRSIELLNAQDADGFRDLIAPDVDYIQPLGVFHGREAVVAAFEPEWKAFSDGRHEVLRVAETPGGITAECTWTGTHDGTLATPMGDLPATHRRISVPYAIWVNVEAGLAKKIRVYADGMDYAVQLGMMPAPQPA